MKKTLKGEKYIYALMALTLCKKAKQAGKDVVIVGSDNRMRGGFNYERRFRIGEHDGRTYLSETKSNAHFADFSRAFYYIDGTSKPTIYEPTGWEH